MNSIKMPGTQGAYGACFPPTLATAKAEGCLPVMRRMSCFVSALRFKAMKDRGNAFVVRNASERTVSQSRMFLTIP
jgi:hypothetical protein